MQFQYLARPGGVEGNSVTMATDKHHHGLVSLEEPEVKGIQTGTYMSVSQHRSPCKPKVEHNDKDGQNKQTCETNSSFNNFHNEFVNFATSVPESGTCQQQQCAGESLKSKKSCVTAGTKTTMQNCRKKMDKNRPNVTRPQNDGLKVNWTNCNKHGKKIGFYSVKASHSLSRRDRRKCAETKEISHKCSGKADDTKTGKCLKSAVVQKQSNKDTLNRKQHPSRSSEISECARNRGIKVRTGVRTKRGSYVSQHS